MRFWDFRSGDRDLRLRGVGNFIFKERCERREFGVFSGFYKEELEVVLLVLLFLNIF